MYSQQQIQQFTKYFKALEHYSSEPCVFPLATDYDGGVLPAGTEDRESVFRSQMLLDWNRSAPSTYYLGGLNTVMLHGGQPFSAEDESSLHTFLTHYLLASLEPGQQTLFLKQAAEHLQQGALLHHLGFLLSHKYNGEALAFQRPDVYQFRSRCFLYPIEGGIGLIEEAKLYGHNKVDGAGRFAETTEFNEADSPVTIRQFSSLTLDKDAKRIKAKILAYDYALKDESYMAGLEMQVAQHQRESELDRVKAMPSLMRRASSLYKTGVGLIRRASTISRDLQSERPALLSAQIEDLDRYTSQLQTKEAALCTTYPEADLKVESAHEAYKKAAESLGDLTTQHHSIKRKFSALLECFTLNNEKRRDNLRVCEDKLQAYIKTYECRRKTINVRLTNIASQKKALVQRKKYLDASIQKLPASHKQRFQSLYRRALREIDNLFATLDKETQSHRQQLAYLDSNKRALSEVNNQLAEMVTELEAKQADCETQSSAAHDYTINAVFKKVSDIEVKFLQGITNHVHAKRLHQEAKKRLAQSDNIRRCLEQCDETSLETLQKDLRDHKQALYKAQGEIALIIENQQAILQTAPQAIESLKLSHDHYKVVIEKYQLLYDDINAAYQAVDGKTAEKVQQCEELSKVPVITAFTKTVHTANEAVLLNELKRIDETLLLRRDIGQKAADKCHRYVGLVSVRKNAAENATALLQNYYCPRGGFLGQWWHCRRHHKGRAAGLRVSLEQTPSLTNKLGLIQKEITALALDDSINHKGSYFRRLLVIEELLSKELQPSLRADLTR